MLKTLLQRWSDWTGDRGLEVAIRAELRRQDLGPHSAKIREVRLIAIERPGWVQVRRFYVEAKRDGSPVMLGGVARDDGRKSKIEVLITSDTRELKQRIDAWCDGLIRR